MDLGEPFKRDIWIKPGAEGSFVVHVGFKDLHAEHVIGFTSVDDLLIWMAKHGTKSRVTELKEDDVVKPTYEYQKSGMDALNGLKRTTAAKTFAERVELSQALAHPAPTSNDAA